jgi:hypothetical protein
MPIVTRDPDVRTTYSVNATPVPAQQGDRFHDRRFIISLSRYISGGICGPHSENASVIGYAGIDAQIHAWGYERTGEFGAICLNGFATAPVQPIDVS